MIAIKDMTKDQYKAFMQNLKELSTGIKAMLKELGFKKSGAYIHAASGVSVTLVGLGDGYRLTFLDIRYGVIQINTAADLEAARGTIAACIVCR